MRLFLLLLIIVSFASACSEPRCPSGYAQTGDICHRCKEGTVPKGRQCVSAHDSGAQPDGSDEQPSDDAGEPEVDSGDPDDSATEGGAPECVPKPEVCGNELDDDCDGEIDESSDVAEQCNGLDDNCDGLVDEDLYVKQPKVDIWPQTIERQNFSQVAMLPREAGGGWLLYRAGHVAGGVDERPRNVTIVGLNPNGENAGIASQAQSKTVGTAHFVADGDGRWVVVASRRIPVDISTDTSQSVRVQLFKAENLDFVGEYDAAGRSEIDYTTFVYPLAVSVFEAVEGAVHVLVAYGTDDGSGSGWSQLHVQAIKRAATGQWSSTGDFQLFDVPSAMNVAISRVPCREEWVVATATNEPSLNRLARYTPSRRQDGEIEPIPDAVTIGGLGQSGIDCQVDPEVVLAYTSTDGRTRLRRWNVERTTGDFRLADSDVSLQTNLLGASLKRWRGRWWLSGADSDGALTLMEVRFGAATPITYWRLLDTDGPNPGNLAMGTSGISHALGFGGATAVLPIGDEILVSAVSGNNGNLTDLLRARQSTLDQAAAVTFRIGCP
jgi:hypothetical protein